MLDNSIKNRYISSKFKGNLDFKKNGMDITPQLDL